MHTQQHLVGYPSYLLHFIQNEINFSLNTVSPYQEQHNICHSYLSSSSYKTLINTGRWNQEEHKKFIEALFIYGNEWKKVQKYIQSRTATQSRSHAQKFFLYFRKKFIDVYSEKALFEEESNELYERVLNILIDMPQCEHIAKYCGSVIKQKGIKENKKDVELEIKVNNIKDVIKKNFAFSNIDLDLFMEERKKKFLKVILSLIQVHIKGNYSKSVESEISGEKEVQDENKNCLNVNGKNYVQHGNCYNVCNMLYNPFKLQFDVGDKQNEEERIGGDENYICNNQYCTSSLDTSNFFDNY